MSVNIRIPNKFLSCYIASKNNGKRLELESNDQ